MSFEKLALRKRNNEAKLGVTHTDTLGFPVSIDIMTYILYKLYIISLYTNPTPKPTYHGKFLHVQKTLHPFFFYLFCPLEENSSYITLSNVF